MIVSADFSVLFNQDNGVDHVFDIDEVRNYQAAGKVRMRAVRANC